MTNYFVYGVQKIKSSPLINVVVLNPLTDNSHVWGILTSRSIWVGNLVRKEVPVVEQIQQSL